VRFGNRGGGAAVPSVSDGRLEATTPLTGGAHLSAAAGGRGRRCGCAGELGRGPLGAAGERGGARGAGPRVGPGGGSPFSFF